MEIMKKKREQQLLQTKNAGDTQQAHHKCNGVKTEKIVLGKRPMQKQNLEHAVAKKILVSSTERPKDLLQDTSSVWSAKIAQIKQRICTEETTQVTA